MTPSSERLVHLLGDLLPQNSQCSLVKRIPLQTQSRYSNPAIEAIDVRAEIGQSVTLLELVCKQLKPSSKREVLVYRELCGSPNLPIPKLYASAYDDDTQEYWILIERLVQRPSSPLDLAASLAQVLSTLHASFWNTVAIDNSCDTARTQIDGNRDDLLPDKRFAIFVGERMRSSEHCPTRKLVPMLYSRETLARLKHLVRALSEKTTLIHHEANSDELVYSNRDGRSCLVDLEMMCFGPVYLDFVWLYRMTNLFHTVAESQWAEFKKHYGDAMAQRGCGNPCDERFDFLCGAAEVARRFWEMPALVHRIDSGAVDLPEGRNRIESSLRDLENVTNELRK